MHPIDALAHGIAIVLGAMLSIGMVASLIDSYRQQKAEDEFWNGYILREGKMNPDYTDRHRVYRMLGTYKSDN
ncbi:MAG: hypothetical protein CBB67_021350 [Alteromonadaceae bacterium TMED7]|nr:hypothetical protein [Euryarchaeota archaeon]RPH13208.1 MAG: hypothetical protein CBB67_021350 [Alteromonadaceae bacterium TMED7]|tara:strand:+ start:2502 stop:2720 length:219 start_codon:yes stop_codon:yes gene_type:complete